MNKRLKFEVFAIQDGQALGWYAQIQCDCGSTLSCGEPYIDARHALLLAQDSLAEHLAKHGNKCGHKPGVQL